MANPDGGFVPGDDDPIPGTYSGETPYSTPEEYVDELELGSASATTTVKEIEDSVFTTIAVGNDQILRVLKVECQDTNEDGTPDTRYVDCYVQGEDGTAVSTGYNAHSMMVTFCLPDKPSHQVADFFLSLAPNSTIAEQFAYNKGTSVPDKVANPKSQGFNARKLIQFLSHLRFTWDDEKKCFDPMAYRPKNWKFHPDGTPKLIKTDVIAGQGGGKKEVKDKKTGEVVVRTYDPRNQPGFFKYKTVSDEETRGFFPKFMPSASNGQPQSPSQAKDKVRDKVRAGKK